MFFGPTMILGLKSQIDGRCPANRVRSMGLPDRTLIIPEVLDETRSDFGVRSLAMPAAPARTSEQPVGR